MAKTAAGLLIHRHFGPLLFDEISAYGPTSEERGCWRRILAMVPIRLIFCVKNGATPWLLLGFGLSSEKRQKCLILAGGR
jgi:hypothetical protein